MYKLLEEVLRGQAAGNPAQLTPSQLAILAPEGQMPAQGPPPMPAGLASMPYAGLPQR